MIDNGENALRTKKKCSKKMYRLILIAGKDKTIKT